MEKKLAEEVEQLKAAYPDTEVELWCEDEHRLGLKPIIRRVYIPYGETPIANRTFKTLDDLEEILFHRCQSLLQQQDLIQGLTSFHWWIKIGA